jgi:hypothetical protein
MERESRQPFLLRFRNQGSKTIPLFTKKEGNFMVVFRRDVPFFFYSKTTSRAVYIYTYIAVSDFAWNSGGFCFTLLLTGYTDGGCRKFRMICGSPIPEYKSNRIRITVYRPADADTDPLSLHRVDTVSVANVSELYPASVFSVDVNTADSKQTMK